MNGIPAPCQPFQDEIDALNAQLALLQEDLQRHKPGALEEIRAKRKEIADATAKLQACLKNPPQPCWTLAGIEWTQAIQYFLINGQGSGFAGNNTVPMVANKDLILRVYVNVAPSRLGVVGVAFVTGTLSYIGYPDLSPINGSIQEVPTNWINRGNANHTLNFRVPAAHCTGVRVFNLTVFGKPPVLVPDTMALNLRQPPPCYNEVTTFLVSFDNVPQVRIHGVLIHYTGRNLDIPNPSGWDLLNTLAFVEQVYPIDGFNYTAFDVIDFAGDLTAGGGGGCGVGWDELFTLLQNMRNGSHTSDIFVGLLPSGVPTVGVIGCGGGGVAISFVDQGQVLAQEIGHAFGRRHAPCGNPAGPDPNYPTYDSYPSGSIGEFGFDTSNSQVWNPAGTFDYMSYCGPVWTSPYTYIGLKDAITASQAATHPDRAGGRNMVGEHLHLNFRMHNDGKVDLLPSYILDGPAPAPVMSTESPVWCHLVDAGGNVINSYRCRYSNPHQDPEGALVQLHANVPWDPATKTIRFLRGGTVTDKIDVEAGPPRLAVKPPIPMEKDANLMKVEWDGQHAQKLNYMLRYTHDGGKTWRAVAADLTASSYTVHLETLPGGDRCAFQVVASSGLRTTTALTDYFEVKRKPRQARILSPNPGAAFRQGESVVLVGRGFSPDFGTPEFAEVVWNSNLDGHLGVGFRVVTNTLSIGRHRITVSVPDGMGGEVSAGVAISVSGGAF
jgi:hypothetical protein